MKHPPTRGLRRAIHSSVSLLALSGAAPRAELRRGAPLRARDGDRPPGALPLGARAAARDDLLPRPGRVRRPRPDHGPGARHAAPRRDAPPRDRRLRDGGRRERLLHGHLGRVPPDADRQRPRLPGRRARLGRAERLDRRRPGRPAREVVPVRDPPHLGPRRVPLRGSVLRDGELRGLRRDRLRADDLGAGGHPRPRRPDLGPAPRAPRLHLPVPPDPRMGRALSLDRPARRDAVRARLLLRPGPQRQPRLPRLHGQPDARRPAGRQRLPPGRGARLPRHADSLGVRGPLLRRLGAGRARGRTR